MHNPDGTFNCRVSRSCNEIFKEIVINEQTLFFSSWSRFVPRFLVEPESKQKSAGQNLTRMSSRGQAVNTVGKPI